MKLLIFSIMVFMLAFSLTTKSDNIPLSSITPSPTDIFQPVETLAGETPTPSLKPSVKVSPRNLLTPSPTPSPVIKQVVLTPTPMTTTTPTPTQTPISQTPSPTASISPTPIITPTPTPTPSPSLTPTPFPLPIVRVKEYIDPHDQNLADRYAHAETLINADSITIELSNGDNPQEVLPGDWKIYLDFDTYDPECSGPPGTVCGHTLLNQVLVTSNQITFNLSKPLLKDSRFVYGIASRKNDDGSPIPKPRILIKIVAIDGANIVYTD